MFANFVVIVILAFSPSARTGTEITKKSPAGLYSDRGHFYFRTRGQSYFGRRGQFCFGARGQHALDFPIVNTANQIVQTSSTAANMIKNFQEVKKVYDQGKEYYDKLKAVHNLLQDAKKVRNTMLLVGEISDIYVNNFQKMMADPNFRIEELTAIAFGYTKLLQQSADMILELKDVVNVNGLSMTDAERMDIINYVHDRLLQHRNLVSYYTRKNISISYLRAQKAGDTDRVMALYGTADERYW